MEDRKPIIVRIDHDNLVLVYDFNELEIEQAELAREVGEFRYHLTENEASSLNEVLKSRSADWLPIIASFLFKVEINGEIKPFNKTDAESRLVNHFKKLPVNKFRNSIKDAVEDFFTNIDASGIASSILANASTRKSKAMLLDLLMKTQGQNVNNTPKDSLQNKKLGKKTA